MWVKYIDQDWYKESPEIYHEELKEVCNNLECQPEDIWMIHSDEDYELVEQITEFISGNYSYKDHKVYSTYADGGLVSLFSKVNLN